MSFRRPYEKIFQRFLPEIRFQACFPNRQERFKIRNEGTVDDFATNHGLTYFYLYLFGYRDGLDAGHWPLFRFFGVEKVPPVGLESVMLSQNSCQK